jgi:hypothetical protein
MTEFERSLRFGGIDYDMAFAANLIPAFFFPLKDLGDLLCKSTELLLSQGLISEREVSAIFALFRAAEQISTELQRQLVGTDERERRQALDVLTHALEFSQSEDSGRSMEAWRAALHRHELLPNSIDALRTMISFILYQHSRGQAHVAGTICNCLDFISFTADRLSIDGG